MERCFLNSQFGVLMLLAWAIFFMLRSEAEFHKIVTYIRMNQSRTVFQTLQICICLCVPVLKASGHDCVWGSRRIAPRIFNVGTKLG